MAGDKETCLAAGCEYVLLPSPSYSLLILPFLSGYVSKPVLVPDLVRALTDAGEKKGRRVRLTDDGTPVPGSPANGLTPFELELPPGRRNSRKRTSSRDGLNTPPTMD